jgi:hypothetical protein
MLATLVAYLPSEVLFTADLKSFSSYGLEVSNVQPPLLQREMLPSPPVTPSPSPLKRVHADIESVVTTAFTPHDPADPDSTITLVERVKRRRKQYKRE